MVQIVTVLTAVWFSGRGIVKRVTSIENKIDKLPCNNDNCPIKRPKIVVVRAPKKEVA